MAKQTENTEPTIELAEYKKHVDKGLAYTKKDYEDLLLMSNEALRKSKKYEKDPTVISELWGIYYNSFAGLIRSGILCSRQMGTDGFPEIHIQVKDRTYKVRESILVGIFREDSEYIIKPWKDESASYVEDSPFKMLSASEEETPAGSVEPDKKRSEKRSLFGRKNKAGYTPIEMEDISSPVLDNSEPDREAFISIEMTGNSSKKTPKEKKSPAPVAGLSPEAEKKLRDKYEAEIKAKDAETKKLEEQLQKHKTAYKKLKLKSEEEKAEALKYTYDPDYDHYYSEELPALMKSLEFSHSNMLIQMFCAVTACIGIAVAFIFMI